MKRMRQRGRAHNSYDNDDNNRKERINKQNYKNWE